jgi:hypothetical protein
VSDGGVSEGEEVGNRKGDLGVSQINANVMSMTRGQVNITNQSFITTDIYNIL